MSIDKQKIKEWFKKNYPNVIGSYQMVNELEEPMLDIIEQCFNDLAPKSEWVSVDGWKSLPEGKWLVMLEDTETPQVADNTRSICVIGNNFAFDLEKVVAYTSLPEQPK